MRRFSLILPVLPALILALATGPGSALGKQHSINDNIYRLTQAGFSPDGRIFAYTVTGLEEKGSNGRYFARMYFLDVHKNSFLKPKGNIVREENTGDIPDFSKLQEAVLKKSAQAMRKYKIQAEPSELEYIVKVSRGKRKKRNFFTLKWDKFELRLIPKGYRVKRCGKLRTKIFTLALLGSSGKMINVLQRDKKLYRSRGCPVDYLVYDKAFIHGKGIVAFVYSTTPSKWGGVAHKIFKPLVVSGTMGKVQAKAVSVSRSQVETWRDPVTGMEFVKVPGGLFEMGCHTNAGKCSSSEKPVRTVRLDAFWVGKHEVTQGQWMRIMGNNPSGFKKGDNYPVEQVSWNDAQKFIRKLNARSSAKFRLPSEAQWEYACRVGGKAVTFGTGNGKLSSGNANYDGNNQGTTSVGRYQANGLGLHDMSGNLWEWVQDTYTKNYNNVGTDNPIYERSGGAPVYRGGGWRNGSSSLRCSNRNVYSHSLRGSYLGFRLLRLR